MSNPSIGRGGQGDEDTRPLIQISRSSQANSLGHSNLQTPSANLQTDGKKKSLQEDVLFNNKRRGSHNTGSHSHSLTVPGPDNGR